MKLNAHIPTTWFTAPNGYGQQIIWEPGATEDTPIPVNHATLIAAVSDLITARAAKTGDPMKPPVHTGDTVMVISCLTNSDHHLGQTGTVEEIDITGTIGVNITNYPGRCTATQWALAEPEPAPCPDLTGQRLGTVTTCTCGKHWVQAKGYKDDWQWFEPGGVFHPDQELIRHHAPFPGHTLTVHPGPVTEIVP